MRSRRSPTNEIVIIRTTAGGKLVFAVLLGSGLAIGGVFALMLASSVDDRALALFSALFGIALLAIGALAGVGGVVEALSPIRVHSDAKDVTITRRTALGGAKVLFVPRDEIEGAIVQTESTTEDGLTTHAHRIALVRKNGEPLPLASYYHLDDLDEARALAGRIERLVAPPAP